MAEMEEVTSLGPHPFKFTPLIHVAIISADQFPNPIRECPQAETDRVAFLINLPNSKEKT